MTENDQKKTAALPLAKMPKWLSNALLVLVIVALYLAGVIFVLPRLGFET